MWILTLFSTKSHGREVFWTLEFVKFFYYNNSQYRLANIVYKETVSVCRPTIRTADGSLCRVLFLSFGMYLDGVSRPDGSWFSLVN